MIGSSPKTVDLAVDPHENLIEVPASTAEIAIPHPPLAYDSGERQAEAISPKLNRLMANVDAALVQQIRDIRPR